MSIAPVLRPFACLPVLFVGSPGALPQASSECFTDQTMLPSVDGPHAWAGWSVAVSGDTALVGAYNAQRAYVYVHDGASWSLQATLLPTVYGGHFGSALAIDGDTAVVGAHQDSEAAPEAGAAYVFVREGTSWSQQAKLWPAAADVGDDFGRAVDVDGDTLLVGATADDDEGLDAGAAYVFVRQGTTWTQQAKLLAFDGAFNHTFGASVSVSGEVALVGAPDHNPSGAAYVFARSGTSWSLQAQLGTSEFNAARFGTAVSVDAETAVVTAITGGDHPISSGLAWFFHRSGNEWLQWARLVPSDGAGQDRFGTSVALSGDLLLIGAHQVDGEAPDSGAAYVYAREAHGWSELGELQSLAGEQDAHFGWSVALDGGTALVGARWADGDTVDEGRAEAFFLPPLSGSPYCTCSEGVCGNPDPTAGCASSIGEGARLFARGRTSPDEVDLLVTGGRPGQPGLFFQGDDLVIVPFGDGLRCAGGGVVRLGAPAAIGPHGTIGWGPCFGDPTISSVTGVVPGSGTTKRYQLWYRDPGGPCGSNFNLSNGYRITW